MSDNIPMRFGPARRGRQSAGISVDIRQVSVDTSTLAGGGNLTGSVSVTRAGWTPSALAGFSTGAASCFFAKAAIDGDVITYNVRNAASTSATVGPIFWVLYVREV